MSTGYQIKDQGECYFLTLQVVEWVDIFSRKNYRDIIIESLKYCQKEKGLQIFAYVIMMNHVHLLVRSEKGNLSNTIRDFKSFTSKEILKQIENGIESRRGWMMRVFRGASFRNDRHSEHQFWTHENHAIHVYSEKFIEQKLNYIHQNPVRSGFVELSEEYLYSSAKNYADKKGLIDVEVLHIGWKTV